MSSRSGVLYTGVTNDLGRRVREHKQGAQRSFANRYRIDRLVYFERTDDPALAIAREKEIKGWVRRKKVSLIMAANPELRDLSEDLS